MDTLILEPLKYYNQKAKERHKANVTEHFDALLKRSGIDVEANRATVKKYHAERDKVRALDRRLGNMRLLFGILIALAVIGIIVFVLGVTEIATNRGLGIGLILGGLAAAVISLVVAFTKVRSVIKKVKKERDEIQAVADKLLAEAEGQMAPLNALFNSTDTLALIEKTMPELDFSPSYTQEHNDLLIREYDYIDLTDDDTSVVDTLSGTLFGNPFLYERYLEHTMGTYVYTGTLVISWTETRRDSKGKLQTVRRTQTLHASVEKPKPYYNVVTHLGYGSQAAPDLSFSRTESDTDELSDRALARRIRKGERELQKRAEKSISAGGDFREMANSEFDVLFGAHNRNHEVQFRLLYTPLAQTNTVDLLRSKDGYGDDFNVIKQGRYNIVKSLHAQSWQMTVNPAVFRSYDVDASRESFISFNEEYFKSVFFDFAPLMAIPAYQDEPVGSMRAPKEYLCNYTQYEHESLANAIGYRAFAHPDSHTEAILKTTFIDKNGTTDRVRVTAHSYTTVNRTDFVSVLGGDGRLHAVPVHWKEYIPVVASRDILLRSADCVGSFGEVANMHGITAVALDSSDGWERMDKAIGRN